MMHMLRGSPRIIVYLFYFICLWNQSSCFCPYQCRCNDNLLLVNCDVANLDVVPITLNPELKVLYLNNNSINAVKASLTNYRNLDFLDLSYNVIKSLDEGNFNDLNHLRILKLNENKISKIRLEAFFGLNSLEELYVKGNELANLSSEVFTYLKNLNVLDLSNNHITSVNNKSFEGLKILKKLILRSNELTSIPSASFQYVPSVTSLDLGFNFFSSIPEHSFDYVNSLKELFLDNCGIHIIIPGAFKFLNSLEILHIYGNELNDIPTKAFYDVIQLKEIYIGDNNFYSIKSRSFSRLQFLETINISSCHFLESVEKDAFSDNHSLKKIILNFNKALWYIHDDLFDNHSNIQFVSLRGNAFETFQSTLLPWGKLHYLDVKENPIVCNCSILWLWKLLMTKNSSTTDRSNNTNQLVCLNPPEMRGMKISSLNESDLDCYASDARHEIIIIAILTGVIASVSIIMVSFKYRGKVAGLLKTKWRPGRKEPQYQKTNVEEESTILQAAHQLLKMTPVTEL